MLKKRKREQARAVVWLEQKKRNQAIFEKEIKKQPVVTFENIIPSQPLYIIGNGFDLMHKVQSSYYSFRDSLGKKSSLRFALENTLTPEDIWADFEESLGKLNISLMGSRDIVDMWLNNYGVFDDEDAGGAEYYMAIESAANPIITIVNELQKSFKRWVNSLYVGTEDRPLSSLIKNGGRVLCFNYTEFLEMCYGIKDICYIHGCRKNKKEKLVLGHSPETSSELDEKERKPKTYRQAIIDAAQEDVLNLIGEYDEELIKDSREIIKDKRNFFEGLADIDQIIVIGHSVSPVDWEYFREVQRVAKPDVVWYFGCHGLNDLRNITALINELSISAYRLFRTDGINTRPNLTVATTKESKQSKPRRFVENNTCVEVQSYNMRILESDVPVFEVVLPSGIRRTVINDVYIFVVLSEGDFLLFGKSQKNWTFINLLKSFEYQKLINRRLNHIYITDDELMFVYNNRVRKYDLKTGELVINRAVHKARYKTYPGTDIFRKFVS